MGPQAPSGRPRAARDRRCTPAWARGTRPAPPPPSSATATSTWAPPSRSYRTRAMWRREGPDPREVGMSAGKVSRILVTGGAGFIGGHLVDVLVAQGSDVAVLDSLVRQVHGPAADDPAWWPEWTRTQLEAGKIEAFRCDVRDRIRVTEILRAWRPNCVVHLAAEVGVGQAEVEIERYVDANVHGTSVLLASILDANQDLAERATDPRIGIRRLVVAGSMSSYGEGAWAC